MKDRLNKILKTIDNLEDLFKDSDIEFIFALEELRTQINEMLVVAQ